MTLLDPPAIPADDRGFLLGDALFETLRVYGGTPFRLDRHLHRLERSAEILGFGMPPGLRERVDAALREWGSRDGVLRITVSRGSGRGGATTPGHAPRHHLTVAALTAPAGTVHGAVPGEEGEAGRGLRAALLGRVVAQGLTSGHKSSGYAERIEALRRARSRGLDEALVRDEEGRILGGSTSNILAVLGRVIVAPGRASGALPGITRALLVELAEGEGLEVEDRAVGVEDVFTADEVLLSSSVRGVVPVVALEGRPIGGGTPGPLHALLSSAYREVVLRETSAHPPGSRSPSSGAPPTA